ncbi:MATH domain-containing protein [Trichostrongylus colubriformis]|uniref:MATH domain-containing protein n=1 Tax=Trichostrongylus colubriformis TaxID=6319 RepID=A0AAN8FSY3_TRICO
MTVMVAPYGDAEGELSKIAFENCFFKTPITSLRFAVARQYLSVYVTLIKGDYDAILRWPFTHPMTFTAHATNAADDLVRKFTPNPIPQNLPFLGRPATRNAAFGIQRFCKLMDVDKYSIEGDFFLSVHVDLSSLDREPTPRMPSDDL